MQEGPNNVIVRHSSLISPPPTPVQGTSSDWSNDSTSKERQQNIDHEETGIEKAVSKRKSKKFIQTYAKHIHTLKPVADPCCHDSDSPDRRRYDDKPFCFNMHPVPKSTPLSRPSTVSIITLQPRTKPGVPKQIVDTSIRPSSECCFRSDKDVTLESQKRKQPTMDSCAPDKARKAIKLKAKSDDTKSAIDKNTLFEKIDIDQEDAEYYSKDWIPNPAGLGWIPVKVAWKGKEGKKQEGPTHKNVGMKWTLGSSLAIDSLPYYDRLHQIEADIAHASPDSCTIPAMQAHTHQHSPTILPESNDLSQVRCPESMSRRRQQNKRTMGCLWSTWLVRP